MINKGNVLYYAQMMPTIPLFEVLELKIRTVEENWIVGIDKKSKQVLKVVSDILSRKLAKVLVDEIIEDIVSELNRK